MSDSKDSQLPRKGDVVLVKQGIGIVRYVGSVEFDPDESNYIGIEIKGPPVVGGTNGSSNGKKYFKCKVKRGIFAKENDIIRIVTNEEILDKCAHLYDIVQGRSGFNPKGNKHFIDRETYNNLLDEHNMLKAQYASLDKSINEYDKMVVQYAILREKMGFMEGNYKDKISENAKLNEKITDAERKLGTRLSQMDMSNIMKQLKNEWNGNDNNNNNNNNYKVPDYGKEFGTYDNNNNNGVNGVNGVNGGGHKSSLTAELDAVDFGQVAADVAMDVYANSNNDIDLRKKEKNGKKKRNSVDINNDEIVEKVIENNQKTPTHFRKFSNTTKIAMKKNEEKKKQEQANQGMNIEKGSFRSVKARSSMDINAQELQEIHRKGPRKSRDSVDIDNNDLAKINENNNNIDDGNKHRSRDSTTIDNFPPEYDNENDNDSDNNESKHLKARESVDINDEDIKKINNDNNDNQKQIRKSRESKTLNNDTINNLKSEMNDDDDMEIEDDPFGNNLAKKMKDNNQKKKYRHGNQVSTTLEDFEKPAVELDNNNNNNNNNDDDADDEF